MKGEEGDPEHPSTKLTDLRDIIDEEEGEIKFDEIKVRDPAMCGSRKFCQRGSNFDNVFFLADEGREDPSATIAGHHRLVSETPLNGVSMVAQH